MPDRHAFETKFTGDAHGVGIGLEGRDDLRAGVSRNARELTALRLVRVSFLRSLAERHGHDSANASACCQKCREGHLMTNQEIMSTVVECSKYQSCFRSPRCGLSRLFRPAQTFW